MLFYIKQYGWKRNMIRIARISDIDAVLAVINDAKELLREEIPAMAGRLSRPGNDTERY